MDQLDQATLEDKILASTDSEELDSLVKLFNVNLQKKNIVRTSRLSELQEKVTDQIESRLCKNADEFSNKDLLDYFKTIQDTINKSGVSISDFDVSAIQINQNNLTINMEQETGLSRQSKERVAEAVNAILAKIKSQEIVDVENIQEVTD